MNTMSKEQIRWNYSCGLPRKFEVQKKVIGYEKGTTFLNRKPIYEKEVKHESKSTKGRSDGSATDKKRMGTHGRSDHVEPDRKKASKVCATKVPKKVSKPKKSPK